MTKNGDILMGLGAALIVGVGAIGGFVALGPDAHPAQTAAHQLPQATTTKYLPGATITLTPAPLPRATITKTLPQATKTITKKVPQATITCGHAEDDCYPDYIGKGRWVIRHGERPMPKATKKVAERKQSTRVSKKVPGATIPGVCRHPSITRSMIKDCVALAGRGKVVAPGKYEIPAGKVLVKECTDQYRGAELADCLKQ
jgi:hypothetical protein